MDKNSIFTFGKYKGQTVSAVLENDPSYILWASKNISWIQFAKDVLDEIKRDPPDKCTLYIYRVNSEDKREKFFKIGITSKKAIGDRYSSEYDNSMALYYRRSFFRAFDFSSRKLAEEVEQKFHTELASYRYTPKHKFGGYTECYNRNNESKAEIKRLCEDVISLSLPTRIDNSYIWKQFRNSKKFRVTKSNPKLMSKEYQKFKNNFFKN